MSVEDASSVLDRYFKIVMQENRTIDARGVMQVNRMISLSMEDVFIHLTVRMNRTKEFSPAAGDSTGLIHHTSERGFSLNDLSKKREAGFFSDREEIAFRQLPKVEIEKGVSTDKLWQRSPNWVLLGDPGAGKTTLLKHFTLKGAAACQTGKGHLPVLVPLRLFGKKLENHACWQEHEAILNYITQFSLVEMGFTAESDRAALRTHFEYALSQGNMLFLLDGLDEQRDAHIQKLTVKAIESLQRGYSGNRFIVTSRIVGYDAAPLSAAFNSATLEPFNDDQMKRFFYNWCYALEKSEDPINDEHTRQRGEQHATQLLSQIESNPGVRQLATNPLLCTIIGLIHHRGAALPHNRAELYKLCIDTFIFNWEMHKRHRDDQDDSLDKDQTQAVLEEIALHIHENYPENRIPEETLNQIIAEFLINQQGLNKADALQKASQMLSLIRDVSGLLIDRGNSEYGFFHLTFQEYLTARAITRKKSKIDEYLNKYLFEVRWREVIRLAAAHQGQKDPESGSEFIETILCHKHAHDEFMYYSFRMAFLCLKEARVELSTSDKMLQQWIEYYLHTAKYKQMFLQLLKQPGNSIRYFTKSLKPLFNALQDKDPSVRKVAAQAFGNISDTQAVNTLINALQAEDPNVRKEAVQALGNIKDVQAVTLLINALQAEDPSVRKVVAQALGKIGGKQVVTPLINALKDDDYSVRKEAALALGNIGDLQAISPLIDAFKDKRSNVSRIAAQTLRNIESAKAVKLLISMLKDNDYFMGQIAAQILGNINDVQAVTPLINALQDENRSVRKVAAQALGNIDDKQAVTPLINVLQGDNPSVRMVAAQALGNIGDARAISPLIDALQYKDYGVRIGIVQALGNIGDAQAAAPLINLLQDNNYDLYKGVIQALQALGNVGDKQVVTLMINALQDKNYHVRMGIAQALGNIGDAQSIVPLIDALKDKNIYVSQVAAQALGNIGDAQAISPLIDALKDKSFFMRQVAAQALGNIGDAQAVAPLINALKDENFYVRRGATQALGKIGGKHVATPLINALKDDDYHVRKEAAQALGNISDAQAILPLIDVLKDEDYGLGWQAMLAIEKIDLGYQLCSD